jgi:hypothetical protein
MKALRIRLSPGSIAATVIAADEQVLHLYGMNKADSQGLGALMGKPRPGGLACQPPRAILYPAGAAAGSEENRAPRVNQPVIRLTATKGDGESGTLIVQPVVGMTDLLEVEASGLTPEMCHPVTGSQL